MIDEQLEADLSEAALLESKRGPGRPPGSRNKSSSRTSVRNRVRAYRERQREKAEEAEEKQTEYENFLQYQKERNLVFIGELAPGQNCRTPFEELEIASEFAFAMEIESIRAGETIRTFINRVLRRWCEIGTPLFCRETKTFGEPVKPQDTAGFDERAEITNVYEFPNGCDESPFQEAIK